MHHIFSIIFLSSLRTVLFICCLQHVDNGILAVQTTIRSSTCSYTIIINQHNNSQCPTAVYSDQYGTETPHFHRGHAQHYKPYKRKIIDGTNENKEDLTDSKGDYFPRDIPAPLTLHSSRDSRYCHRRVASLVYRLEHLQQIQRAERQRAELYENSVKGHHTMLDSMGTGFEKLESNVSSLTRAIHSMEQKLFRLRKINNNLEHKMASVVLDMDEVSKNIGRQELKSTSGIFEVDEKEKKPEDSTTCAKIAPGIHTYEDCGALKNVGFDKSGEYYIKPQALPCSVKVWCDMETEGGGWTTFQRRVDGTENFFRNWTDYRDGFGHVSQEFWLGNNYIFLLTNQKKYELRVELWDFKHDFAYAKYRYFKLDGERDNFRIHVSGYTGTARNGLYLHNFASFSTIDRDNDKQSYSNCAEKWDGGWWFTNCWQTYLNGRYHQKPTVRHRGISWNSWKHEQLMRCEMKIRLARD